MKKYLVITSLLLWGMLSISWAQQPAGRQGQAGMGAVDYSQIGQKLQLTEEQKAHWNLLAGKYSSEIASVKQDAAVSTEDRKAKFKDISTRMRSDLQNVLTESQLKTFDELTVPKGSAEKKGQGNGKGRRGGGGGGRRGGMGMGM